jgi:hypothetical protein
VMTPEELLSDPSLSFWFKDALKSALKRDPVDALSDVELLLGVLSARTRAILDKDRPIESPSPMA